MRRILAFVILSATGLSFAHAKIDRTDVIKSGMCFKNGVRTIRMTGDAAGLYKSENSNYPFIATQTETTFTFWGDGGKFSFRKTQVHGVLSLRSSQYGTYILGC
jgi:hypothetical protein